MKQSHSFFRSRISQVTKFNPERMDCELQCKECRALRHEVYEEDHMATRFALKTSVCSEYECLLLLSKTAFDDFRIKREELNQYGQNNNEAMKTLIHLRTVCYDAYSRLIHHFDECEVCQYVSNQRHERPRDWGVKSN